MKITYESKTIKRHEITVEESPVMCFESGNCFFAFLQEPRSYFPELHYEIRVIDGSVEVIPHQGFDSLKSAITTLYEFGDDVQQIPLDQFLDEFYTLQYSLELLNSKTLSALNNSYKLDTFNIPKEYNTEIIKKNFDKYTAEIPRLLKDIQAMRLEYPEFGLYVLQSSIFVDRLYTLMDDLNVYLQLDEVRREQDQDQD